MWSQKHKCLQRAVYSSPVASPACVWPVPIIAGTVEGVGKDFSFLHLHRFSWRQLMGLGPDLTVWDTLIRTTVETGFTHCWAASSGKWSGHCLQHFEEVSKDTPHFQRVCLPYAESNGFFKKKSFLLLNTTVHFRCTFFSNSCELMAKKKTPPHSPALSCVCAKGPWAEGMGLAGPCCPACRVLRGGCAPFPS